MCKDPLLRDGLPLHLGTENAGLAVLGEGGFCNTIHRISQAQFKSRFVDDYKAMNGASFSEMGDGGVNSVELIAQLINRGKNIVDGIAGMQRAIEGSVCLLARPIGTVQPPQASVATGEITH